MYKFFIGQIWIFCGLNSFLFIKHARTIKDIKIDGRSEAKSVKLLGITFNNKFAFHDHATNIVNKMSSRIGQLKKIIPYADEKTSNMLATSLMTSVASYGAEVYAKDKQVTNRVQVKMNQAMRMITCSGNRTPINSMLKRLNWLKFDELIIYNKVMLLENCPCCKCCPVLKDVDCQRYDASASQIWCKGKGFKDCLETQDNEERR